MCIRKKKLTVLILAGAVLLLGLPLAACGSAALPSASSPASQSLPPEPAKEPKQSTSNGASSDPPVEEPEQSSLPTPAENAPESSPKAFPSMPEEEQEGASGESIQEVTEMKLKVEVGEQTFSATLEENTAVNALVELLRQGPITLWLHDDSGFEKVGPLGQSLPAEDRQTTTQAGDIVLYTGNQIVMFYGSNSWSYTRLACVDDLTGWEEALGSGDVTGQLSL